MAFAMGSSQPSTYTQTKYPIMLVHGVSGFDDLLGFYDYWYKFPDTLKKDGATVRCAEVSPWNSIEQRGEDLLQQIKQFLAETGKTKVNLIAHSQGSPTSRYVAYMRPDLVASITTIAGPHKGTPVGDFLISTPNAVEGLAYNILELEGQLIYFFTGNSIEQDAQASIYSLSSEGIAQFNQTYPCAGVPVTKNGEGAYSENYTFNGQTYNIKYFSWTGTNSVTNVLDPLELLFGAMGAVINLYGHEPANDGAVPAFSARFGQVLRADYPWNHADEVNQVCGILGLLAPDPLSVVRTHANRLKTMGL
ncbi:MAG: triacylglycerol lipase [Desulfobacterales bacterium]|nr:triacylglycerol lipase [Desulfobacterales bacterium]